MTSVPDGIESMEGQWEIRTVDVQLLSMEAWRMGVEREIREEVEREMETKVFLIESECVVQLFNCGLIINCMQLNAPLVSCNHRVKK